MKKFFRGFTLAELLLCVGIIGIVSAMGMTVAKISTDKAYNLFYYAGYINLYNAIADAKSQGKETNSDIMNHARDLLSKNNVVATLPDTGIKFLTYKAVWACTKDMGGTQEKKCMDVPVPLPNNGCGIYEGRTYCQKSSCPPGFLKNGVCTCMAVDINGECIDKTPPLNPEVMPDLKLCPPGQERVNDVCQDICPGGQTRDENGVCQNICPEGQTRDEIGVCRAPEQAAFVWPTPDNSVVIETVNGIKYYYPNNLSDGMNGVQQLTGDISGVKSAFPITMTVPQRQTRANNGIATVHLLYIDLNGGYLIPVADNASVDLQNRRDLLPAYIDNGKVGRNSNIINRNNWTYERPAYRSYRETYCLLRGRTVINNVISCDGISANQAGVLAIANPQKAR